MAADYHRAAGRYGGRGERYAHIDAGCASQNVALQAEAPGLGTVVAGDLSDQGAAEAIGAGGTPLAIMPVGFRP